MTAPVDLHSMSLALYMIMKFCVVDFVSSMYFRLDYLVFSVRITNVFVGSITGVTRGSSFVFVG
jgi:hypothetical protein